MRLRQAVLAAAVSASAVVLVGCDQPGHVADKKVRQAVAAAPMPGHPKASNPAVAAAVATTSLPNDAKAPVVDILPVLGKTAPGDTDALADWRVNEAKLHLRQRAALLEALRTAGKAEHQAAIANLQTIVNTPNATPESTLDPLNQMAAMEIAAGDAYMRDASDRDIDAGRMIADIHRLLAQVRLNASQIVGYQSQDPTAAIAALEAFSQGLSRGLDDEGKPATAGEWKASTTDKAVTVAVPSVAKIDADIAALQAELDKAKTAKDQAEEQAKKLSAEADKLDNEAGTKTGKIAEDISLEAAKQREEGAKQAIEAQNQQGMIDSITGKIAILQTRKPPMEATKKLIDTRKDTLTARWEATKTQIKQLEDETQALIGAPPAAPATGPVVFPLEPTLVKGTDLLPSTRPAAPGTQPTRAAYTPKPTDVPLILKEDVIAEKAARLQALLDEAEQLRVKAAEHYNAAMAHNAAARQAASTVASQVDAVKNTAAREVVSADPNPWNARLDILDPSQFEYREAVIQERLARVASDRMIELLLVTDLQKQADAHLKAAAKTLPPFLDFKKSQTDVDAAFTAADAAFKLVEDKLNPITSKASEGGGDSAEGSSAPPVDMAHLTAWQITKAARALQANAQYEWANVLSLANKPAAKDKLTAAELSADRYFKTFRSPPPGASMEILRKLDEKNPSAKLLTTATRPVAPPPSTTPTTPTPEGTTPGTPTPAVAVPADWVEQAVGDTGATIKTPPDWKAPPTPLPAAKLVLAAGSGDGTSLNIIVTPKPPGELKDGLPQIQQVLAALPGYKAISSNLKDLNGMPSAEVMYEASPAGAALKFLQVYVQSPTQMFIVTFTSPTAGFDAQEASFRQMASSLKLPAAAAAPGTPTPPIPTPPAPGTETPTPPTPPAPGTPTPENPTPPTPPGTPTPATPAPGTPTPEAPAPPPVPSTPATPGTETPAPPPAPATPTPPPSL